MIEVNICLLSYRMFFFRSLRFNIHIHDYHITHNHFPLLFRFENRRVPRTKSIFERQSSRRYSSFDCDMNGYYENNFDGYETSQHDEDIRQNRLNLIDTILRQNDDNDFAEIDDYQIAFNDDDENDEYAL